MSSHKGITCDVCLKENFVGIRYKCLACRNYDLCAICYNARRQSQQHSTDHPVQAILTQIDFEVFYGHEATRSERQFQSYTCPYCGTMGFSDVQLRDHIATEHASSSTSVICPLCAALDASSVSLVEGLSTHIALNHPEVSTDRESANSVRVARLRTQHARHGVWMNMQAHSRRAEFGGYPSDLLSARNREDILSHLSTMHGPLAAEDILSLELQLQDRRTASIPFEHLMGSEDLRVFYDPILVPATSAEPTASSATNAATTVVERNKREHRSADEPVFLLMELDETKTEEEKEAWEEVESDRSVFIQDIFLSATVEPTDYHSSYSTAPGSHVSDVDQVFNSHRHPVLDSAPNSRDSVDAAATVLTGPPPQSTSETSQSTVSVPPLSLSLPVLLQDARPDNALQRGAAQRHISGASGNPLSRDKIL